MLHISMVDWRGYLGLRYMCILLYIKVIWCSGFPEIYAQLEEGMGSVCAWVYVHSSICETYLELLCCIFLWWIGGGTLDLGICAFCYILKLFGVVIFQRSMLNWRRGWVQSAMGI